MLISENLITLVYIFVLIVSSYLALRSYPGSGRSARILIIFVSVSCITEVAAFFAATYYRNNMLIYAVYGIVEFFLITSYFTGRIRLLKSGYIPPILLMSGVLLGVANIVWMQGWSRLNTNFLYFEAIVIISLSLGYCLQTVWDYEGDRIPDLPHFLFSVIIAGYWTVTVVCWGFYNVFVRLLKEEIVYVNTGILIVNILAYSAIGYLFYRYPKLKPLYA